MSPPPSRATRRRAGGRALAAAFLCCQLAPLACAGGAPPARSARRSLAPGSQAGATPAQPLPAQRPETPAPGPERAQVAAPPPPPPPPLDAAEAIQALAALETSAGGIGSSAPPAGAPALLGALKADLRGIIGRALDAVADAPPAAARERAMAELERRGVRPTPEERRWGSLLDLRIEQPAAHPELRVAVLTLAVPCGEDSSLYVFERGPAGFRLALAQESDLSERTSEGNRLSYGLVPGRPKGHWALVVSSAGSSCVSLWRTLTTRVLLRGTDPLRPRAAFAGSLRFHLPAGYTLAMAASGFTLRWTGDPSFLPWYPRWGSFAAHYVVDGDSVRRAPPLAADAESFLLAWLGLPWAEAERWLCPAVPPSAGERWHRELRAALPGLAASPDIGACAGPDGKARARCEEVELMLARPGLARASAFTHVVLPEQGADRCVEDVDPRTQP
ncbi:hypothetical protein [Sorangium sp. So ce1335]|uniref:hypothetical protein n=1 Tax=Sorangium sp. So ce1335 TaxID=3133335 RepID=UPI003F5EF724